MVYGIKVLKKLSIRKRIIVVLVSGYVVTLIIATIAGYFVLKADTIRESKEKATILLVSMKATRTYLKEILRPKLQKILPDKFILEGMSSTYMSIHTAKFVRKENPDYIYRNVSLNPLNKDNLADSNEKDIINQIFKKGKKRFEGIIRKENKKYYVIAIPIICDSKKCLKCHGNPSDTYPELKIRYGTQSGYGYKVGEVVGGLFTYVPTEVPVKQAIKQFIMFIVGFSISFFAILFIIDRVLVNTVVKPIEKFVKIAEDVSRGKMDKEFDIETNDEMKLLANAFNRMKLSLAKAMDILKKK